MDIFPQDLGDKWHLALVRLRSPTRRDQGVAGFAEGDTASPRLGPLGRYVSRGSGLDDETAAKAVGGMRQHIFGPIIGLGAAGIGMAAGAIGAATSNDPGPAIFLGAYSSLLLSTGLLLPRFFFRRVHKRPLGASEIEAMLPTARDDLERAYLTLVIDAVRQKVPPEVEKEVRAALNALGDAIERLPSAQAAEGNAAEPGSTEALRQESAAVRAEAAREPDPVAAASLERQADALDRRADAVTRSRTLLRRTAVLRRELTAQTEALRAGLVGFYTGATDMADLSHLAEAVRGVAAEATSVADAREEIDAMTIPPAGQAAETIPLRAGGQQG